MEWGAPMVSQPAATWALLLFLFPGPQMARGEGEESLHLSPQTRYENESGEWAGAQHAPAEGWRMGS